MAPLRFSVDILIERIPLASRWSDARWQPCALIVTDETPRDAGNARASGGPVSARVRDADDRWRCSGFVVELHPTESEGYWLNLSSDSPKAFVQWRVQDEADAGDGVAILPVAVTLSYRRSGALAGRRRRSRNGAASAVASGAHGGFRRAALQTRTATEVEPQSTLRRARSRAPTMSREAEEAKGFSLRRWSRRKLASTRSAMPEAAKPADPTRSSESPPALTAGATMMSNQVQDAGTPASAPAPLPGVESLTFDSDFTAFMRPGVDPSLRRQALAKLLHDPRFNVMDGLDIYIDDYSKPDPLDPEVVKQMVQWRNMFPSPETQSAAAIAPETSPAVAGGGEPTAELDTSRGTGALTGVPPADDAGVSRADASPAERAPPTAPDRDSPNPSERAPPTSGDLALVLRATAPPDASTR